MFKKINNLLSFTLLMGGAVTLGARRGQEPPGYPGAGAKDSCKPSSLSAENCSGSSVRSGRGLNHQVSSLLSAT